LTPTGDFALIELPLFILAATFVIMLAHWSRFLSLTPVLGSETATWKIVALIDGILFLLYMMFLLLFGLLPASTVKSDPFSCFSATAQTSQGYQRSDAQMNVQIACHTFIVFISLSLAFLFAWAAAVFVRQLPAESRSLHLFRFTRASKITTPAQQTAKLFQTLVVLSLFFASDSIFQLIFYLFTSYYQSSWSAIVLFFVEVVPVVFLTYQMVCCIILPFFLFFFFFSFFFSFSHISFALYLLLLLFFSSFSFSSSFLFKASKMDSIKTLWRSQTD
jgi:hypothetical protein